MNERIILPGTTDRKDIRTALIPQLRSLFADANDAIATMANMTAVIKDAFGWHWVGFYRVMGTDLVLGPFQGPVACDRIGYGKGVCGAAWKEERTIIVPDVDQFPGHIACSSLSRSELVTPVRDREDSIKAVLDIDSIELDDFTEEDAAFFDSITEHLRPLL